ncbi:MAG TPA: helix-turn-helix domain-containing protein [Vicinamibacteria bacterium]|jgi:DNA-binding NtrC family response regulator
MAEAIMAGEREDPGRPDTRRSSTPAEGRDLKTLVNEYERQLILSALGATRGHQRRAARCLGISPSSLHEKMKRLGIKVLPTWTGGGGGSASGGR